MTRPSTGRFEFDRAELWADGVVHVVGVVAGIVAVTILLASAAGSVDTLAPLAVYGASLLAVLCISAAYNMWPASRLKWILRRLDHSAIYLLIAGTYTPLLMWLEDAPVAGMLIVAIWTVSLAGVAIKLIWPARFDRLAIVLYLAIGWSGVALWDSLGTFPTVTLALIVAGGLLYSLGVVFHVWHSLRFQNAIWHAFVLAAAACHYLAVYFLVATA